MLSAETRDILAFCVLAAIVATLAVWVVRMVRRSPFSPAQSFLYGVNYVLTRVLWRASVQGRFPIPEGHGAVVVCNHRCPLDPAFIALSVPRAVHWLVAREYCEHPAFRKLLEICCAIPVRRGASDPAAARAAIRIIRQGGLVGIFPEGRINTTKQTLLPGHSGAVMMALKARAPVVPCYICGAPYDGTTLGCLLMPARVRLKIGRPIDLSPYFDRRNDRDALDEVTRRILLAIAQLGGDPEFRPKTTSDSATNRPRRRNSQKNDG